MKPVNLLVRASIIPENIPAKVFTKQITDKALDTSAKVLTLTTQAADAGGKVLEVTRQIQATELDAELAALKGTANLLGVIVDVIS